MKPSLFSIFTIIALACTVIPAPSPAQCEQFGGYGIVVAQLYSSKSPDNRGAIVVLHVPAGSEAQKAGMQAGDVIVEIDGAQTAGRKFADVVFTIRGPVGSSSDLKIRRMPGDRILTMRITRTLVDPEK